MNLHIDTALITEEQLLAWTGYTQRAALERWLVNAGITFKNGSGGRVITTMNAVLSAFEKNPDCFDDFEF